MPARSRLCPACEQLAMARTDDTEWSCFRCGLTELPLFHHQETPTS